MQRLGGISKGTMTSYKGKRLFNKTDDFSISFGPVGLPGYEPRIEYWCVTSERECVQ